MALKLRRAATVLALLLGAACADSGGRSEQAAAKPTDAPPPVDLELVRQLGKTHEQYVSALLRCSLANPSEWAEARRTLELLHPYHVFDEDPELIRRFRAGDDQARKELGRRGGILNALLVFPRGYDRKKWEEARQTLVDAGQPGQILLSTTLVEILMNGQFRDEWDHARATLVETGPVALETVIGWARELVARTPADMPIYRIDDLTTAGVTLVWFGEKGTPVLDEFRTSAKPNVRRAYARAVGESVHIPSAPAVAKLMAEDPEWTVRTAAAESLGRLGEAKALTGPVLVDRMKKERDRLVLKNVIEAIGQLKYEPAVPDLMLLLEVPSVDTANLAMGALYHITGERLTRKDQWVHWYATVYPRWKDRARRP